ncbi:DUF6777 domain-containing protein [Spirillospora sp. NBC_01491]|uniref:DUF6777 domain-containing protein n=1 Tax=Spirillospora sp. NBC_01491 TaxID=2976007 RepID=UPI002E2FB415|nr:DUF6777 domain-containing protein [Spirillospora sp. NBC_01491]
MAFAALVGAGALAGCGDAGATITRLIVGTPGPDPYTPQTGTDQRRIARRKQAGGTREGDSPGLYGGTRHVASCDPRRLVRFLRTHPDKAAAWAGAHGIAPAGIGGFVSRLTPVLLRTDTLVTNHGFRDGRATGGPAVLQAGTGVLINEHGIPTVKCNCGNPLTRPKQNISPGNARYTGSSWNGFGERTVTEITPPSGRKGPISSFVLVDPRATMGFARPRATSGESDGPVTVPPPDEVVPPDGSPTPGRSGGGESGSPGTGTPLPDDSGGPPSPGAPSDGTGDTGVPGTSGPPEGSGESTPPPSEGTPPPVRPSTKPSGPADPPGAAEPRPAAPASGPPPRSLGRIQRDPAPTWPI